MWALSVTPNLYRESWVLALLWKSKSSTGRNILKNDVILQQASSRYLSKELCMITTLCPYIYKMEIISWQKAKMTFLFLHSGCLEVLCYQPFPYRSGIYLGFLWTDCSHTNVQVRHQPGWIMLYFMQQFQSIQLFSHITFCHLPWNWVTELKTEPTEYPHLIVVPLLYQVLLSVVRNYTLLWLFSFLL